MNALHLIQAIPDEDDAAHHAVNAPSKPAPALQLVASTLLDDATEPSIDIETSAQVIEIEPTTDDSGSENTISSVVPPVPSVPAPIENEDTAQQSKLPTSIPDGFALFNDGIYELPSEDADPVFICSPLRVDAMFADPDGQGWGRVIVVRDDDGRWHDVPVLNAELARHAPEVLALLFDRGLTLGAQKTAKDRLLHLIRSWKPEARLTSVHRLGWTDDSFESFVLGDKVIGAAKVLPMLAQGHGPSRHLAVKGSIESWRDSIGSKCQGNPLMVLAVSLAFSGPLLAVLHADGGGLHFRGTSSSGKTTLLRLAASVWGSRGLIGQWRATSNGLEATASALNDMVLPLDEIAEIAPRALHEAIYMLANGRAKARMAKDATAADSASWRLALISSGEVSVAEKLKEASLDVMIGHEVRLIDIEADTRTHGVFDTLHGAKSAAAFADALRAAAQDHHGAVGREFVRKLSALLQIKSPEMFERMVRGHVSAWLDALPSAPDGQIQRVARRFAIIAVAGRLATAMKLTGWGETDAVDAAHAAFIDWYERRFGDKRDAVDSVAKRLKAFLDAELSSLQHLNALQVSDTDVQGWRDDTRAYLTAATWSKLYPDAEGATAAKALLDMQMLVPGDGGRLMRKAPRGVPSRPRLYTLNLERIDAYKIS